MFSVIISCRPIKSSRDSFRLSNYCYNSKNTGLDTIINLHGYYAMSEPFIKNIGYPAKQVRDTSHWNCLFLKDGFFLDHFNLGYYLASANELLGFYKRGGHRWGRYTLNHDTIKAQFIESPGGMSWEIGQVWFKIIDRNTIQQIFVKAREPVKEEEVKQYQLNPNKRKISPARFVFFDSLPDPDKSWLKNEKWFWCDENQYKEWKRKLREKK